MASNITIEGAKELQGKLKDIKQSAENEIEQTLFDCALIVERDAKIAAPVNKKKGLGGRLRTSITHKPNDFGSQNPSVTVGTNVSYARFQEFGTGQRGKASGVPTPADYEYGSSKGIPAQPYLFPAYNKNKEKILKKIAQAVRKGCGL